MKRPNQPLLISSLALRDLRDDLFQTLCMIITIAAVAAPLLVLLGLRNGLIDGLRSEMVEDPFYRELRPELTRAYAPEFFERLGAREDVAFVTPSIMSGVTPITIENPETGAQARPNLVPSAPGDAMLTAYGLQAPGADEVVLSTAAAEELGVQTGQTARLLIRAVIDGISHEQLEDRTVSGVLPLRADGRPLVFAPLDLVLDVERYREGHSVPARDWEGRSPLPSLTFDGVLILSEKDIPRSALQLAILNTGFTEVLAATPDRILRSGLAPGDRIKGYEVASVGGTTSEGLRSLEDKLRRFEAIVLPFSNIVAESITFPSGDPIAAVPIAGLDLKDWQSNALGLELPWEPDSNSPPIGGPILAPKSWSVPQGTTLEISLRFESTEPLVLKLVSAGQVDGDYPVIPTALAAMVRTGQDRNLEIDVDSGHLLLRPPGSSSFRLYAKTIDDVEALAAELDTLEVPTRSRRADIERVRLLDTALTTLFFLIAIVGVVGGMMALTSNTVAAVRRKTFDLGMLRLMGFRKQTLFLFPIVQVGFIATAAIVASIAIFFGTAWVINTQLAEGLELNRDLAQLSFETIALIAALILGLSMACSLVSASRSMKIDPSEALRVD